MRSNKPNQEILQKELLKSLKQAPYDFLKIYPNSVSSMNGLTYGLIKTLAGKKFVVFGEKGLVHRDPFKGETYSSLSTLKVCDLSPENTDCLMSLFPYTKPVSLKNHPITIGTGDRLGVATPGHIRAIRKYQVRPVLAQQSVRENNQTGRNFSRMIEDAAWAVFQEGYEEGYGADGDHVKSLEEIKDAFDAGASMITLDLSEKLAPDAFQNPKELIEHQFREKIDRGEADVLLHLFLGKEFLFKGPEGEISICFDEERVKRNILLFHKAIDFTEEVYEWIQTRTNHRNVIDFEISIDETPFPTSPENHLFFIIVMGYRGVRIDSLAPRFVGEFQKGIDYRGDLKTFREQFYHHALISKDYGNYKLSIHSGSDKFSVFPLMGGLVQGGLHLKTAGTSWLEAVKLITLKDPALYREMHQYALSSFKEASRLYHVTTDLDRIPKLDSLLDQELSKFLDLEDSRQLLHITYGFLLNAKAKDGTFLFRDRLYQVLSQYEEDYWSLLEKHIENHLTSLGLKPHPFFP